MQPPINPSLMQEIRDLAAEVKLIYDEEPETALAYVSQFLTTEEEGGFDAVTQPLTKLSPEVKAWGLGKGEKRELKDESIADKARLKALLDIPEGDSKMASAVFLIMKHNTGYQIPGRVVRAVKAHLSKETPLVLHARDSSDSMHYYFCGDEAGFLAFMEDLKVSKNSTLYVLGRGNLKSKKWHFKVRYLEEENEDGSLLYLSDDFSVGLPAQKHGIQTLVNTKAQAGHAFLDIY